MAASWIAASWMAASCIKNYDKTPVGELEYLSIFWPPPHVNSTPPWLLRSVKVSTSSELYPDMRLFFFIWMPRHPVFCFALTCDLRDVMPHKRSLTLFSREAEDFPRGDNHSKHMPLLTYLAWLQPVHHNPKFVFIHFNTAKVLLVVKTFIKNIE